MVVSGGLLIVVWCKFDDHARARSTVDPQGNLALAADPSLPFPLSFLRLPASLAKMIGITEVPLPTFLVFFPLSLRPSVFIL